MTETGEASVITITSGVSAKAKWPFVHISWGENAGALTVTEAREHALRILEVCTAAEHDSAIVKLLANDEEEAAKLLWYLRQSREAEMGSGLTRVTVADIISMEAREPDTSADVPGWEAKGES